MVTVRKSVGETSRIQRGGARRYKTIVAISLVAAAAATVRAGDTPPHPLLPAEAREARETAPPSVSVGPGSKITLHLVDVPLPDALRMLSEPTRRNIVLAAGANGQVSCSLYGVTFEQALDAMLISNGLGYRSEGDFIYVHPAEEIQKIAKSRRVLTARIFRLTYLNALTAKDLITPLLSPEVGKVSLTPPAAKGLGSSGSSTAGGGVPDTQGDASAGVDAILVTDYIDKLDQIGRVIADLDVRPKQVLVEATILRATLNEDNALGIDFTTVGGIDFQALSSVSPAAQTIATGTTPGAALQDTTFTARTDFNDAVPNGGFTFGIIKDQVGFFIRALESITDTDILANPKILALNKQIGQVVVGRRDGYLTTTITETTAIQQVEFLETGTVLSFRPFIGEDGTVRMEIHPKDSTGGLTSANLPFEQTTEVTTNVLVQDGHTILIGGLFREVSTATRGQVPGLGNIPIAGALFRTTRDSTVREEVIILLTVHIVKGDADRKASKELYEDTERYRVGMRKGLQWFGRERLAEAHYQSAVEHLSRGDTEKALWDAEMAMHNYPRHVHAAKLVESIRNKRQWESEASSVRSFLHDRIAEESGVVNKPFDRPMPPFVVPPPKCDPPVDDEIGFDDELDADVRSRIDGRAAPTQRSPAPSQAGTLERRS